ncbi:hypothetical protein B0H11DRAFT_2208517 [Mycena galericulata]|nr:hypothetical protein B0H11DRAFT_2208517 [Mycena galericulata]
MSPLQQPTPSSTTGSDSDSGMDTDTKVPQAITLPQDAKEEGAESGEGPGAEGAYGVPGARWRDEVVGRYVAGIRRNNISSRPSIWMIIVAAGLRPWIRPEARAILGTNILQNPAEVRTGMPSASGPHDGPQPDAVSDREQGSAAGLCVAAAIAPTILFAPAGDIRSSIRNIPGKDDLLPDRFRSVSATLQLDPAIPGPLNLFYTRIGPTGNEFYLPTYCTAILILAHLRAYT